MHRLPNRHGEKIKRARDALSQAEKLWGLAPVNRGNQPDGDRVQTTTRPRPGTTLDLATGPGKNIERQTNDDDQAQ